MRAGKHRKHIKNQKTTLSVGFGGCKGFLFLLILDWKLVFLHPLALYLQEGVASREMWRFAALGKGDGQGLARHSGPSLTGSSHSEGYASTGVWTFSLPRSGI